MEMPAMHPVQFTRQCSMLCLYFAALRFCCHTALHIALQCQSCLGPCPLYLCLGVFKLSLQGVSLSTHGRLHCCLHFFDCSLGFCLGHMHCLSKCFAKGVDLLVAGPNLENPSHFYHLHSNPHRF